MQHWDEVAAQIGKSKNYWVCSTRPDGRPHAVPVWGVFVDGAVLFSTGTETRKARNLAANPNCVIHLESGDEVVILEGVCEAITDKAVLKRAGDAYEVKYKMRGTDMPGSVIYRLQPAVALAWRERDFPVSATRWKFPR